MTREQSLVQMFKRSKRFRLTMDKLLKWDEDKTAIENSIEIFEGNPHAARTFANRYGITYRPCRADKCKGKKLKEETWQ